MRFGTSLTWLRMLWTQLVHMLLGSQRARLASPTGEGADDEAEALARAAGRCMACGMCDRAFTGWPNAERDRFFGPMTFVLRTARGSTDWAALGPMVSAMERADVAALEGLCPAQVPFVSLVRAVRSKVPPPAPRPPKKKRATHDPG